MYKLLDKITLLGSLGIFFALLIGLVFLFKYILKSSSEKIIAKNQPSDDLTKKYHQVDVNKYKGLIGNIGLAMSIGLVLLAFEFPNFAEEELVDLGVAETDMEEQIEVPPTEQKPPPPPPKIVVPKIIEVDNEEEIEEPEIEFKEEPDEEEVVDTYIAPVEEEPEEEEVVDQIFTIVEESAAPEGGMKSFYKYIRKNLSYPRQAKRMGIEGKVFLSFIVDKDGSITNISVIRGIGGGCDEEATRILKEAPKWKPGKQRGRAVKQKMTFPINFKLK